jgi:hypothetical protein
MKPSGSFGSLRASAAAWLTAALFSAAIVFPFHPPFRTQETPYYFEMDVSSNARGIVQLFFDVGRGFNEADSRSVMVRSGGSPKRILFSLPLAHYRGLRFDPLDRAGRVTISGARIRDDTGQVVMQFPPSQFQATQQIERMEVEGPSLSMATVPDANDPNTLIRLEKPFDLAPKPTMNWVPSLKWFAVVYAGLLVAIAVVRRVKKEHAARAWKKALHRPKLTLALVALAALLLNSYPVIFFGRSFVSPNVGVLLLYETIPTLPGYASTTVVNGMGSDVGAAMWWHVPVSRIQHEAMARDHELPLWNRYDLCGQSLLGQGQSMVGDPLHLATAVLGAGSATAWDIKYLVAKWLFAFGAGLIVLALTDGLLVSALLTASSLFIGFFSFRLNHPALFSLCYSPWILYAWIRVAGARDLRKALFWIAVLLASDWIEINSGTVKEAYVLTLWLNLSGALVLLLNRDKGSLKLRKAVAVAWGSLLLALISAPLWLTFLDTLKSSFTSYDRPDAVQLHVGQFVGFFDGLFYQEAHPKESQLDPSTNFLVLLGFLWALSHVRTLWANRAFLALAASVLVPGLLVFGVVPKAAIVAVPFLANIIFIDHVFSCVLVVLAIPLAGFGLTCCIASLREKGWLLHYGIVLLLLAALLGLYFGSNQDPYRSPFFAGYVTALLVALVVIQLAARRLAGGGPGRIGAFLLLAFSLLAIHWRHTQYLNSPFDGYVFDPQERVDLKAESPAMEFTEGHKPSPSRTVGLGLNLYPGFNQMYLAEGIFGVDALRSREFESLAEALGLGRVLAFTVPQPDETSKDLQAAYDALNVGYFLGTSEQTPDRIEGWDLLDRLDLSIYRSPTAWPRAFYVDRIATYSELEELVTHVRTAGGRPFAAVQKKDLADLPQLGFLAADALGRRTVAATDYSLTGNSTSFAIEAPHPGVVVLSETWLKDDFIVTINGRPAPYFRVNHAFKGVYLDSAGSYRISFRYWPHHLTLALWMAASGAVLLAASYRFAVLSLRAAGRLA